MENGGVKLANGYHNHQNNISHKTVNFIEY